MRFEHEFVVRPLDSGKGWAEDREPLTDNTGCDV